ncbi:hypothetical protein [Acinetobacter sp. TAC-1]|uniref:hypothetical protein n=1 Tax=Acinetobacter sp. TAC-1 TaxID=3027470 RepID=UPI0023AAE4E4|nr:hypothetical protein [Acinetobacter sp. TAC-1]WEE40991.1 hypothetical protein PYV58_07485 [Acinetobacter sp. TAC-1]
MRLGWINLGIVISSMLGVSTAVSRGALRKEEFNHIASKMQKKEEKTSHNKISQAKRRKYKRQGRL